MFCAMAGRFRRCVRNKDMSEQLPAWSDKFETGIKVIDRDHKALFEEIGNLTDALVRDRSATEIEQAIVCLETYVMEHFKREETFMIQAGYPGTEEHLRTHRAMQRRVHCLREIFHAGHEKIDPVKLGRFLNRWLSGHIMKTDMDYVPYLRGDKDDRVPDETARLNEVHVRVPENKRDIVERFVAILASDDPLAKELSSLVEAFEARLDEKEMADARKLFCVDE